MNARSQWLPGLVFGGVLMLAAIAYVPGLPGPLLLDDRGNLELLAEYGRGNLTWQEILAAKGGGMSARPLSVLTFIGNWASTGGEVWHLKLTNLAIHLVCGLLIFWLTGRLLAEPLTGASSSRWWLAAWVGAVWVLSPLLVSTVLYVIQRMTQLSALFVLAGLLAYVVGRQNLSNRRNLAYALWALAFLVLWPASVLSKQNGALLPLLALAIELFFFQPARARPAPRAGRNLLVGLVVVSALGAVAKTVLDLDWLSGVYATRDFTLLERVLTQARVLWDYVANTLLLPGGTAMTLFHDDFPKSTGLLSPLTTAVSIVAWSALLVGAWIVRGTRLGLVLFGPVFFFAAHLVESSVFPLELYFEHRNYLPSYGLYLSLGLGVWYLADRVRARKLVFVVLALIPIGFAIATAYRVSIWRSWEGILLAGEAAHPRSQRVQTGLATLYASRGDFGPALVHLRRADELDGARPMLGTAVHEVVFYCLSGAAAPEAAYARLDEPDRLTDNVYTESAVRGLTAQLEAGRCRQLNRARVIDSLSRAAMREPDGDTDGRAQSLLHFHVARLLALGGRPDRALPHLAIASRLRPQWPEPGLLTVDYQMRLGDMDGARATLADLEARDTGALALHRTLVERYHRLLDRER